MIFLAPPHTMFTYMQTQLYKFNIEQPSEYLQRSPKTGFYIMPFKHTLVVFNDLLIFLNYFRATDLIGQVLVFHIKTSSVICVNESVLKPLQ